MAVAELWTMTADTAEHQVQLVIRAVRDLHFFAYTERSIGPSLHSVQVLKNHLRLIRGSTILDQIGTRFLGGRLICESDLYASIYVAPLILVLGQLLVVPCISVAALASWPSHVTVKYTSLVFDSHTCHLTCCLAGASQ